MAGDLEQQPAAVAEQTVDQDKYAVGMAPPPKRKVRMHADDVRFTMSMKREDLGGTEYLERFAHKLTPEELEEHRQLHEEVAALFRKDDEELEARQAQVARELAEKGYVETDEVDPADEEEYEKWAAQLWKSMTDKPLFKRAEFADPRHVVEGAPPGWDVRPHDAEEDQDYEIEDEDEDEDDYEYDEDKVEAKDEDEQAEVGDDTAALESN